MTEPMHVQTQRDERGRLCAKVRIPVAINRRGEWWADGMYSRRGPEAIECCEEWAMEAGAGAVNVAFVYALVPIPDAEIIHGELEE